MADSLGRFFNSGGVGEAGSEASLKSTLDHIQESLAPINTSTRKIDDGTSTIGRVINAPAIADARGCQFHTLSTTQLGLDDDDNPRGPNDALEPSLPSRRGDMGWLSQRALP